ncbi:MAG: cysteine desulfurase [Caldilineae bacterium]|nr:MAG: cysteine desulfurase [Caldilineae bacterium]
MPTVAEIRKDFPILEQQVHGHPLAYLDSTASSQKPIQVIEAMNRYYRTTHANVHRGVHYLSEAATTAYENARLNIARFINAPSPKQIIYTRNTTESLNLVAYSWGRANLGPGDEVLITEMEHHSNIVPWQLICEITGATLRYVPITSRGELDMEALDSLLTEKIRVFAFTAMSNVLGTINPVEELVARAHAVGAIAVVDGAQSVPHLPTDVQAMDMDFLAFSSHKMLGPTGMGILYGKRELLEAMPPFMGGGDMIREVKMEGSRWNELPYKFEAGTPAIAEAVGLSAAVDYLRGIGMDWIADHERRITAYAWERLSEVEGLRILGPGPERRGGLISFVLGDVHPHDVAAILDMDGIAVRAGHHCAQPIHDHYCIPATTRASFYIYNTEEEVDRLVMALYKAKAMFDL